MESINIAISSDIVTAQLAQLLEKTTNLSPVMRRIAGIMQSAVEDNFAAQGRPKWQPSQRVLKKGGQTLQKSGRLAASITGRSTATEAIVGTNVIYAAIHQFGGPIKQGARRQTLAFNATGGFMSRKSARRSKNAIRVAFANYGSRTTQMPARPFLSMQSEDWQAIQQSLADYLSNI